MVCVCGVRMCALGRVLVCVCVFVCARVFVCAYLCVCMCSVGFGLDGCERAEAADVVAALPIVAFAVITAGTAVAIAVTAVCAVAVAEACIAGVCACVCTGVCMRVCA